MLCGCVNSVCALSLRTWLNVQWFADASSIIYAHAAYESDQSSICPELNFFFMFNFESGQNGFATSENIHTNRIKIISSLSISEIINVNLVEFLNHFFFVLPLFQFTRTPLFIDKLECDLFGWFSASIFFFLLCYTHNLELRLSAAIYIEKCMAQKIAYFIWTNSHKNSLQNSRVKTDLRSSAQVHQWIYSNHHDRVCV